MNIEDIMNDPERVMPSVRDALQAHGWVPHPLAHLHVETEGCDLGFCTIHGLRIRHANPGAQKFYQIDRQQADIILDLRDHVLRMEGLIRSDRGPQPIGDIVARVLSRLDDQIAADREDLLRILRKIVQADNDRTYRRVSDDGATLTEQFPEIGKWIKRDTKAG